MAQLETELHSNLPDVLQRLNGLLKTLNDYSAQGQEQARQAANLIFGIENSQKAYNGELAGLQNAQIMAAKRSAEDKFRGAMQDNAPFDAIASAEEKFRTRPSRLTSEP